jgi:hypothetical protein
VINPNHVSIVNRDGITSPNVLRVDVGDEDVSEESQFRSAEAPIFTY